MTTGVDNDLTNMPEPLTIHRPEHPISRKDIDREALKVMYRLRDAGFTAYLVGGGVRDLYLGKKPVDGDDCFHIKASNDDMEVQFWISDQAYKLPVRYSIVYKKNSNMQYETHFTNWDLNPVIPPSVFEFMPPKNAKSIKILAQSNSPK